MQKIAPLKLDGHDRAIVSLLQEEGRLSNVELAARVGLSESATLRRVKNLEESGLVAGYAMILNQAAVGKPGNVFVSISLDSQQKERLARFEEAVSSVDEVMECYLMGGDVDYLLRVIVGGGPDYERIHHKLTALPGVARVHSAFSLRTVFKKTKIEV
ncbi:MAG: AsnC family transcriptional regulator [Deltaproteobacteria bacterium]|nr:MAG: AsnC family transcriptional regulator [Deltaproteobacteria bacterium]